MKRLRILVSGRVQDVNFRYFSRENAKKLRITGYTKNLPDGRVEILAEGSEENTYKFLQWCRKGPNFAKVEHIEFQESEGKREFDDFSIVF